MGDLSKKFAEDCRNDRAVLQKGRAMKLNTPMKGAGLLERAYYFVKRIILDKIPAENYLRQLEDMRESTCDCY